MSGDDHSEESDEVPDGAAVFPEIPAELGVHPLLLGVVHSIIFLAGSTEDIVNSEAADEAVERIAEYLQRLEGDDFRRVQEDMSCLVSYSKQQRWPRALIQSLKSFLSDLGVGDTEEA